MHKLRGKEQGLVRELQVVIGSVTWKEDEDSLKWMLIRAAVSPEHIQSVFFSPEEVTRLVLYKPTIP